MTTALVLSRAPASDRSRFGMAQALYDEGIRPDIIVGTSVGAVNGAWLAGERPLSGLADLWRSLRSRQIFPLNPLVGLRGFLGRRPNLVPNSGLRRVLQRNVAFDALEDAAIPFSVIVTDVSTGAEVRLDRGPAIEAILASAAIPGVFPPIEIDGRTFIDGGIVDNTTISQAIDAGATDVWVLSTGYSCASPGIPGSAMAMALHGLSMLIEQRFVAETSRRTYPVPVHLIPPPCPISVTPIDFSQTEELIDRARRGTAQWIANGEPYAIPILGHRHS